MKYFKQISISILSFLLPLILFAGGPILTNENGVAIDGYDVVAYHTMNKAVEGDADISTHYKGAKFHFSRKEHLEMFQDNPEKYLPEYGGYCAFAMGKKGKKVHADPETWKFHDGELLLFFNGKMKGKKMNAIKPWNKHEDKLHFKADENWNNMNN